MMLPPSPALSDCDSLNGIDDLDAFLASQGQLSQWPTPPSPKKEVFVETTETTDDESEIDDGLSDFSHIATLLSEAASIDIQSSPLDVAMIRNMLIRVELPLEVIALALNILSGLKDRHEDTATFIDSPLDLVVVGALSLAVSYTNDHAPRPSWWSRYICDCHWTAKRIDRTILQLLGALDFSLHRFSRDDCMNSAVAKLSGPTEPELIIVEETSTHQHPLKLLIDDTTTCWQYGQLTPDDTPPCSASPNFQNDFHLASPNFQNDFHSAALGWKMPLMRFIPLL